MRIYLAAQYSQKDEIARKKDDLVALGHVVTSTWTDEPENPNCSLLDVDDATLAKYAERDLMEIEDAELLIIFTVPPDERTRRGGRHVEYGFALGRGKCLIVCGPRENIFHHLLPDDLVFPNWQALLEYMQ